jgi:hypothetical protein
MTGFMSGKGRLSMRLLVAHKNKIGKIAINNMQVIAFTFGRFGRILNVFLLWRITFKITARESESPAFSILDSSFSMINYQLLHGKGEKYSSIKWKYFGKKRKIFSLFDNNPKCNLNKHGALPLKSN